MLQQQDKANKLDALLTSPIREGGCVVSSDAATDVQNSQGPQGLVGDVPSKAEVWSKVLGANEDHERVYRQGNWVLSSILILLEAKRKEIDMSLGSKGSYLSADEKWKFIEEYCRSHGVHRTKEQCKIKWDNMQPDYRKIKEYEQHRDANALSYFEMAIWERRSKMLPSKMDLEVYQRIADINAHKPPWRGGSLKKEARERKFHDSIALSAVTLRETAAAGACDDSLFNNSERKKSLRISLSGAAEGCNDLHGNTSEKKRSVIISEGCDDPHRNDSERKKYESSIPMSVFVGNHMVPPLRRKRKRTTVEGSVENKPSDSESGDNSSTEEDDSYMIASRFQSPLVSNVYQPPMTSAMHLSDAKNVVSLQLGFDYRDTSSFPDKNTAGSQGCMPEQGSGNDILEGKGNMAAPMPRPTCSMKDCDMLSYIQDREDARHKELLALEREKLTVFRDASCAFASAMNNAMAAFFKIAEDIIMRQH